MKRSEPRSEPRAAVHVERVSEHVHFAHTEHVNWVLYSGPDGVTLVDSGYVGQRPALEASLDAIGRRPEEVAAVLITHGHADHLGGAAWLAGAHGTPVYAHRAEVANVRREVLEQAGMPQVIRNAWRPRVVRWATAILPLLEGDAALGVPTAAPLAERTGRVDVPGHPLVRLAAGHTNGHATFEFEADGVIATGDALVTGHATSPLAGPQLLASIYHRDRERARASLDVLRGSRASVMLPGHGEAWRGEVADAVDAALAAGAPW